MNIARYEVESLLRPIVELPAGITSLAAAVAIGLFPNLFWLSHSVPSSDDYWRVFPLGHAMVTGALAWNALKRFRQSYAVARYQSGLRRLPRYEVVIDTLAARDDGLFLGRAFRWDERHARRSAEASREAAKPHLKPHWTDRWFARNAPASAGDEGGESYLHGVGLLEANAEQDLWISDADRMGHIKVLGTTGVGKSRLAELIVTQDIKRGGPVIIIDPKGDVALMMAAYAAAAASQRTGDFVCFHLAFPQMSARYNLFGNFARITEIANRVREALPDSGNSAAFAEFAWSYVNTIAVGLHALGRRTTVQTLLDYAKNMEALVADYALHVLTTRAEAWQGEFEITCAELEKAKAKGNLARNEMDKEPRTLAMIALLRKRKLVDSVLSSLLKTFSYEKAYQDKLVASLFPLLQKMNTGAIAEILSPNYDDVDDARPILDFESALRSNKIVYIGLDALTDGTVADAVGGAMMSDITSLAGRIYNYTRGQGLSEGVARNHHRVRVTIDEWHRVARDVAIDLLNMGRGAGFDVCALTQSSADETVGFDDQHKAQKAQDNFNTTIILRIKSDETARVLTDLVSEVIVPTITWGSGTNDSANGWDFSSSQTQRITETRVKLITTPQIVSLPRGQAFIQTQGGRVYKARFPMPLPSERNDMPRTVGELSKALLARYQQPHAPWADDRAPWAQSPTQIANADADIRSAAP
jgi:conjugative coupling factor TraD (SXT/TOL subfamily)